MTPSTLLKAAFGHDLTPDLVTVFVLNDETRTLTVYASGDVMVIGFYETKGTIWPPSKDWRTNLEAWKKSLSVGSKKYKAHAGFVKEYISLRPEVCAQIIEHLPKKIYLTGFSQGSAHAVLAWRDIVENFPAISAEAVVFASPRVYSWRSSREFDRATDRYPGHPVRRYTLSCDPVVKLPPWFFNYRHVGVETIIGDPKEWFLGDPNVHDEGRYLKAVEGLS